MLYTHWKACGVYLMAIVATLACNVARGGLETTAGVTVDGQFVKDMKLALGMDAWTYQIEVYGTLTPGGNRVGFNFNKSDGIQSVNTYFKLCPTTGGTALANDVISVSWVNTGISSAFTAFYQANLTELQRLSSQRRIRRTTTPEINGPVRSGF